VVIPRRNLIFKKTPDGQFRAGYRIRVVQRDKDSNVLRTQVWEDEVIVEDYEATRDASPERKELSFELAPSKEPEVALTVRVELEGSARFGERELPIARPSVPGSGIALGDVSLYRQRLASTAIDIVPSLEILGRGSIDDDYQRAESAIFDLSSGLPYLLVQVYDLRTGVHTDSITVEVLVKPGNGDASASWRRRFRFAAGPKDHAAMLGLPANAFRSGRNRIETVLVGGDDRVLELQNYGLDPSSDSQWEENLRVIENIASDEEYQRLKDAAPGERATLWASFWARLDPDPKTPGNPRLEQHFARVAYARENFRDGGRDGALSDRGRVYTRLGPPDSIESQTMLQGNASEYELWHYLDLKVVFYFRDDDGLGHWRLVWREQS
jgi:GWxTD domain-containing protein